MEKFYTFPDQIEELKKLSYELVLVDTCWVLTNFRDFLNACNKRTIKDTKRIPVLCDFIQREIHFSGGREFKRLVDEIRDRENKECFILFLKTPFKTVRGSKGSLDALPKWAKHTILKIYRNNGGLEKESRHRDFALLTVGVLFSYAGISSNVLSLDNEIKKACRVLSDYQPCRMSGPVFWEWVGRLGNSHASSPSGAEK